MKKICCINIVLSIIVLLFGCASNEDDTENDNSVDNLPEIPSQTEIDNYDYALNFSTLGLAKKSGCLGCHTVDTGIVGPAWKAVSLRYQNYQPATNYLINKIKDGGMGAWSNKPMPPYSPRVSDVTIQTLVERILQGEDGIPVLTVSQSVIGHVLADEIDKFEFLGYQDFTYVIKLVSSIGDADLFVYDLPLQGDQSLIGSSEVRNGIDSVTITVTDQDQYFEVEAFGHSDSEYELTLSTM